MGEGEMTNFLMTMEGGEKYFVFRVSCFVK